MGTFSLIITTIGIIADIIEGLDAQRRNVTECMVFCHRRCMLATRWGVYIHITSTHESLGDAALRDGIHGTAWLKTLGGDFRPTDHRPLALNSDQKPLITLQLHLTSSPPPPPLPSGSSDLQSAWSIELGIPIYALPLRVTTSRNTGPDLWKIKLPFGKGKQPCSLETRLVVVANRSLPLLCHLRFVILAIDCSSGQAILC
ncbi:hypothetical protein KC329_g77 [Hortaea werneckii]|nr:hypothetical protein KC329_g77 [Hortaea werneckii]